MYMYIIHNTSGGVQTPALGNVSNRITEAAQLAELNHTRQSKDTHVHERNKVYNILLTITAINCKYMYIQCEKAPRIYILIKSLYYTQLHVCKGL